MTAHPIPSAALKKHIAILGMNGSGKTSVAKSQIIEPALKAGERVCNIDPTGVGWGLRLTASGKSKGFSIYIVGGDHADFPLFRRDAKAWGEIVGTSSDSYVFDTSGMTVEDRSQWFTDFAETLIRKNKGPLKLVLDEAHLFAPQAGARSGGVAPKMLHATNNLLALGRSKGLMITMISQRPAKLHKDSLTQAHTLIAMALMAPQDRNAVKDWIADQADPEHGKEIIASLPSLKPGEGWVWAPRENVLERVRFSRPTTFDSSSAPDEAGGDGPVLSPINPEAIQARLAAVAKETVANDPKVLRAQVLERDREIATLKTTLLNKSTATAAPDKDALAAADEKGFERAKKKLALAMRRELNKKLKDGLAAMRKHAVIALDHIDDELREISADEAVLGVEYAPSSPPIMQQTRAPAPQRPTLVQPRPAPRNAGAGDVKTGRGELTILKAVAQYPTGASREQLTVLTGYKRSTRDAYLQRLGIAGYVETISGGMMRATSAGVDALGSDYEPLPTGDALRSYWYSRLPEGERKILACLILVYPNPIERDDLTEQTGYKRSTRDAYIQRLGSRKLVTADRGTVRASDILFEAQAA
jgi:hypothetical protein